MVNEASSNKRVKWIHVPDRVGVRLFTFDGEQLFSLFRDYPHALTEEQKRIFDEENPYWAEFFKYRTCGDEDRNTQ